MSIVVALMVDLADDKINHQKKQKSSNEAVRCNY